jgi:hypothetical protein
MESLFSPYHADKTYDLLQDFTKIPEIEIKKQTIARWSEPTLVANQAKRNTKEFHNKFLTSFLSNSVTDSFYTTLQNRAGDLF